MALCLGDRYPLAGIRHFDNKKLSSQSHYQRDESLTPVVPPCLSFSKSRFQSLTRRRISGDTLLYPIVAQVERPLLPVITLRGNHPPGPTCSYKGVCPLQNFLRPAAHEAVLRRRIRSELSPSIGSLSVTHLILCSLNAGQSLYSC